ncbi:hypothetical protein BUALT_Bualt06G0116300 [Buddleja alternifolia]|uniref:Uncharacterized protein n=1 Tax=Buddleja alternifolia TaxID=168488 RepID=A0AAV6XEL5_9LAMI|nr:hypothetical protein BUALT_Bualt06G0116300 [Buddleja alternifolia]
MATRAHDVAAMALRGCLACLDIDSAWRLPVPASTDREVIQRATTEAAEAFLLKEKVAVAAEESLKNVFLMDDDSVQTFMDDEDASFPTAQTYKDEEGEGDKEDEEIEKERKTKKRCELDMSTPSERLSRLQKKFETVMTMCPPGQGRPREALLQM